LLVNIITMLIYTMLFLWGILIFLFFAPGQALGS